jgi:ankyrin repeat protein
MNTHSSEKQEVKEVVQVKVYTEENAIQSKKYARSFEDRTQRYTDYQSGVYLSSKSSSYNEGTLPTFNSAPDLHQNSRGKDMYGDIPVLDSFHSDDDEEDDEEEEDIGLFDPDDVVPVLENGDFAAESDSVRRDKVSSQLRKYVRSQGLASSSSPSLSTATLYDADSPKPLNADNLTISQHGNKRWSSSQSIPYASNTSGTIAQDMGINSKSSSRNIERQLVRSGWLLKQGNVWRSWKRRYFVLIKRINKTTGQQFASLQYYKGSKFGKLRGEINLSEGPLIVRFLDASETKKPFCFEVTRGNFSIVCQAADEEDVSAWVCHLQSLVDVANRNSSRRGSKKTLLATASRVGKGRTTDEKSIRIIAELRRLLHNTKSSEAVMLKNYVKSFDFRVQQPLQELKKFHNSLTESIFQDHSSRILALLEGPNQSSMSRAVLEDDIRQSISRHVEEALYLPLQDGIQSYLRRRCHENDVILNRKLRWLQGKDQTYFNIPLHHISLKDWRQAQRILVQITNHNLPSAKFDILLETLEEIQASYAQEHCNSVTIRSHKSDSSLSYESGASSSSQSTDRGFSDQDQTISTEFAIPPLEIDDIVPIFSFVLTHTGLENLISMKTVLTELNFSWSSTNNSNNGSGSSVTSSAVNGSVSTSSTFSTASSCSANGAAINVLTDALDFVSNVSVPAALEDIFKDQLTLSIDGEWRRVLDFEVEPTHRYGAVIQHISSQGHSAFGSSVSRGSVLVTINGQNVVLWPYTDIVKLLQSSSPPHRFAFIPNSSYFKILTSNKSLWNVALMHACQRGDLGSIQMLLANGADVNYVANECGGNTPLHVAVSALHFNVVSYMLQHGARVKTLGEFGRNALHMVGAPCSMPSSISSNNKAKSSDLNNSINFGAKSITRNKKSLEPWLQDRSVDKVILIVKKLVGHDIQLDAVDMYGNTPIMLLAETGLLHGIDVLMEANGSIDLDQRNWVDGIGALSYSAREGHYDVVEALLDYGAIPDVRTLQGETPLHFAAGIANKKICEILLEYGADVDARTQKGISPLMMAVSKGAARFTYTSKIKKEKAIDIDESSLIETIDFLLEKGAEKESVCCLYRLPIHYAALYGGPIVFEHLMEKIGLNVSVRDLFGKTALAMVEDNRKSTTDRESQEKVARLVESRSSILDAQMFEQEKADDKLYNDELLMDKKEDDSGALEVVAGTFDALLMGLIRFEHYRVEDVQAFIWSCDSYASPIRVVEFLKQTLKLYESTSNSQFVRRMVIHALDVMAEKLKHQTKVDEETSNELRAFCRELFPFNISEDPQCAQWLSASSLLNDFIESPDDFFNVSYCERDYISLKSLLGTMHDKSPTLNFLDDELFTTGGIEVISEQMRKRLSIAGVWNDNSSKSYVVKQPVRKQPASKSPPMSSKSQAYSHSSGPSSTAVDAFSASVSSLTGSFRIKGSPVSSVTSSSDRVRLWYVLLLKLH